jgi:hypothetical protein
VGRVRPFQLPGFSKHLVLKVRFIVHIFLSLERCASGGICSSLPHITYEEPENPVEGGLILSSGQQTFPWIVDPRNVSADEAMWDLNQF